MAKKNTNSAQSGVSNHLRTITLEEHFNIPELVKKTNFLRGRPDSNSIISRICDIGKGRIAEMDSAGIDVQVLSLGSPGIEQLSAKEAPSVARYVNDKLADAVKKYPTRFVGFASLPVITPDKAAKELERMVTKHGFKGAVINGHIQERYLDDSYFWPVLECAEALGVPIYLHPTPPPQAIIKASFTGNFSPQVTSALSVGGWGWHIETAVHIIRIVLSGAFDKYPNLQFIIGHMGETIPFMMPRMDSVMKPELTKLKFPMSTYLRKNLSYSFSGFFNIPCFLDLLFQVGIKRIVFSIDYPFAPMEAGLLFLNQLPIAPEDKELVAHVNAERLLNI